ncbi:hypothetical protein ACWGI1_03920 [Streptomyces sp. NPDC054835]|uniref:hypothetical protein n=1 Tax=Streptomyces sp. NBC_01268 TaxID=2903806 RepID=UPI002E2FB26C|nr:hypothetical protein [Streptomyces sp. NBC_01268]
MLAPAQQLEHPVPYPPDLDVLLHQRVADVRTGEPADIRLQLLYDELVGVPLRDEAGEVRRTRCVLGQAITTGTRSRRRRRGQRDLAAAGVVPPALADCHSLVELRDVDTEDLRQVLPGIGNGDPRFALVASDLLAGLRRTPLQDVVLVGDPLLAPAARGAQPDEQGADPGVAHAVPQEHVTSGPHSGPCLGPRAGSRPK